MPAVNAAPAVTLPSLSLETALFSGATLGGAAGAWNGSVTPLIPGVNAPLTGVPIINAAPAAATTIAGANVSAAATTGGGATAGAAALGNNPQLVAALQAAVTAVTALVTALKAQGVGAAGGGGATAGTGVGACGMVGCTMNHSADAQAGAAAVTTPTAVALPPVPSGATKPANSAVGVAPITGASGAPMPSSVATRT
ncbi:MAG: hypothetical protein H7287_00685 [Thermoleophilia bacterium]|nr:hypothetical protein [Thermoleophilia bacterium]